MHLFRNALRAAGIAALAALVAAAVRPTLQAAEAAVAVGAEAPAFTLPGFDGKEHSLSQSLGEKGAVVIFVSTKCPVSNAYNERMVALASEFQPRGFRFLGINSNKAETPEEMAEHARSNDWNFPVLKDARNQIADLYGATVTPEVFVVDGKGVIRYHGRIDDSQDPAGIKNEDLRAALEAIAAGKEIAKTEAKAFGCTIKRVG